jgi:tetratricopeptide (TPR) repeat protein
VSVVLAARRSPPNDAETLAGGRPTEATREAMAVAEHHGAHVWPLADGTLVAALSGAGAATDQAIASVHLALELRRLLPEAKMALAMGRSELAPFPVGDVIDRAARLVAVMAGPSSEVAIDDVTAELCDGRFEVVGAPGARRLVGRAGVEGVRRLLGRPSPCVGRERELATLSAAFEECVAESVARVVLVTGAAGMGKSRLRHELAQRLRVHGDVEVWLGRGEPLRAGSPLALLAQLIARSAIRGDGSGPLGERLRERVGCHVKPAEVDRVATFLGELTGTEVPSPVAELRAARADAHVMAEHVSQAFQDFATAECTAHPLVIVLEDLHWGDLPSVRALDGALRACAALPLFVLALARPEVHEMFPRLWNARGLIELQLPALGAKASKKLVQAMLGAAASQETAARLATLAAGNAFYLEELIRAVAEGHGEALPETVRAMAQARFDSLSPELRRALRAASVFGEVFWRGGVLALLGETGTVGMTQLLDRLEEAELVERRRGSRLAGETEYGFRHALLRDAAYSALTDADRRAGHQGAGSWLVAAGERDAVTLAEHFERGGDGARAIDWYRRATIQATGGGDLTSATRYADRAIACGADGETLGVIHMLLSQVETWRGNPTRSRRAGLLAMQTLPPTGTPWHVAATMVYLAGAFYQDGLEEQRWYPEALLAYTPAADRATRYVRAVLGLVMPTYAAGDFVLAQRLVTRAHDVPDITDPVVLAYLLLTRYHHTRLVDGDNVTAAGLARAAADAFAGARDVPFANWVRMYEAECYVLMGDHLRALDVCATILERLPPDYDAELGWALATQAMALADLGRVDEALTAAREGRARFASLEDNHMTQVADYTAMAHVLLARGDAAGGEREARAACARMARAPTTHMMAMAQLVRALLAQGRVDEALRWGGEIEASWARCLPLNRQELVRLCAIEARIAAGDVAAALADARIEHERLVAVASRLPDDVARERFWQGVPEHRRLAELVKDAR